MQQSTYFKDCIMNDPSKFKRSIRYYKHPSKKLEEQSFVRLISAEGSDDWSKTEILSIGYMFYAGIPFGIYDMKFRTQRIIPESEYKSLFINSKSWLQEIEADDFFRLYYQACDYLLSSNSELFTRENQLVFKLDRNFHLYVHGDKTKMIEGEDEKGKFVKLYYENSH